MMMGGDKMKAMMQYLKGGQVKLDKNKDGKISGADFKMMMGGSKMGYAMGGKPEAKGKTPPVRTWDKAMANEYDEYLINPTPENKPSWYFGDIDSEGNPVDASFKNIKPQIPKVPVENVVAEKGMRMKYMQGGDMEAAAMQQQQAQGQQMGAPSRMEQIQEMVMNLTDDEKAMVAQLLSDRLEKNTLTQKRRGKTQQ